MLKHSKKLNLNKSHYKTNETELYNSTAADTTQLFLRTNDVKLLDNNGAHMQNITSDCRVVILIPYRNRDTHYHKQMHNLRKIFPLACKPLVIVIQQDNTKFFKRGWLFNIGLHILSLRNIDLHTCVVTHDVDLLASSSKHYFSCETPTQLCSELSCFNNGVPYPQSAGGVVTASLRDWRKVNGYTNLMEGWGGEDDHLFWRLGVTQLLNKKNLIHRPPKGSGKCQCLNDNDHTKRNKAPSYKNIWKILQKLKTGTAWQKDGISDVQYFITKQFIDDYGTQWYSVSETQPSSPLSNAIVHKRKIYTCAVTWASKLSQTIFKVDDVHILTESSKTVSSDILVNTYNYYKNHKNCQNLGFNGKKIVFDGEGANNKVMQNKQNAYYVGRSTKQPLFLGQVSCIYGAMSMFHGANRSPLIFLKPRKNTGKNFLLYAQSNCIQYRQNAFDMIVDLARANGLQDPHALGACAGKHTELKIKHGTRQWHHNPHTMHNYRFTLAMENRVNAGYITEKIINAFLGGTIPIYYGTLDVLLIFNPKSFIFFDILNPTPALDQILWLEKNPHEYYKMLAQPILLDGNATLEKYFSLSDDIGGGKIRHEILNMLFENSQNRKQKHETASCLEFVHITKTGGTAIESVAAASNVAWGACQYRTELETCKGLQNLKAKNHRFLWHDPRKQYDCPNLFTVVRNPYTRMLSEFYCPWTGYKGSDTSAHQLNVWIQNEIQKLIKDANNEGHAIPAYKYVFDDNNQIRIRHVLKYETLQQDFNALMKLYDLPISLPTQRINSSRKIQTMKVSDFDSETLQAINSFYFMDFKTFGYEMVSNATLHF